MKMGPRWTGWRKATGKSKKEDSSSPSANSPKWIEAARVWKERLRQRKNKTKNKQTETSKQGDDAAAEAHGEDGYTYSRVGRAGVRGWAQAHASRAEVHLTPIFRREALVKPSPIPSHAPFGWRRAKPRMNPDARGRSNCQPNFSVDSLLIRPIAHCAQNVERLVGVGTRQLDRNCRHHSLNVVGVERPDGLAPHGELVLRLGKTDEEHLLFDAGRGSR